MQVRRGTYEDMKNVLDLLEKYHQESVFKDVKWVRTDMVKTIEYLLKSRDSSLFVAYNGRQELIGTIGGTLSPHMFNSRAVWASDMFFVSHGAGPALLRHFKDWALGSGAERIVMGVSSGDARADHLLELSGFEKTGGMYVIRS